MKTALQMPPKSTLNPEILSPEETNIRLNAWIQMCRSSLKLYEKNSGVDHFQEETIKCLQVIKTEQEILSKLDTKNNSRYLSLDFELQKGFLTPDRRPGETLAKQVLLLLQAQNDELQLHPDAQARYNQKVNLLFGTEVAEYISARHNDTASYGIERRIAEGALKRFYLTRRIELYQSLQGAIASGEIKQQDDFAFFKMLNGSDLAVINFTEGRQSSKIMLPDRFSDPLKISPAEIEYNKWKGELADVSKALKDINKKFDINADPQALKTYFLEHEEISRKHEAVKRMVAAKEKELGVIAWAKASVTEEIKANAFNTRAGLKAGANALAATAGVTLAKALVKIAKGEEVKDDFWETLLWDFAEAAAIGVGTWSLGPVGGKASGSILRLFKPEKPDYYTTRFDKIDKSLKALDDRIAKGFEDMNGQFATLEKSIDNNFRKWSEHIVGDVDIKVAINNIIVYMAEIESDIKQIDTVYDGVFIYKIQKVDNKFLTDVNTRILTKIELIISLWYDTQFKLIDANPSADVLVPDGLAYKIINHYKSEVSSRSFFTTCAELMSVNSRLMSITERFLNAKDKLRTLLGIAYLNYQPTDIGDSVVLDTLLANYQMDFAEREGLYAGVYLLPQLTLGPKNYSLFRNLLISIYQPERMTFLNSVALSYPHDNGYINITEECDPPVGNVSIYGWTTLTRPSGYIPRFLFTHPQTIDGQIAPTLLIHTFSPNGTIIRQEIEVLLEINDKLNIRIQHELRILTYQIHDLSDNCFKASFENLFTSGVVIALTQSVQSYELPIPGAHLEVHSKEGILESITVVSEKPDKTGGKYKYEQLLYEVKPAGSKSFTGIRGIQSENGSCSLALYQESGAMESIPIIDLSKDLFPVPMRFPLRFGGATHASLDQKTLHSSTLTAFRISNTLFPGEVFSGMRSMNGIWELRFDYSNPKGIAVNLFRAGLFKGTLFRDYKPYRTVMPAYMTLTQDGTLTLKVEKDGIQLASHAGNVKTIGTYLYLSDEGLLVWRALVDNKRIAHLVCNKEPGFISANALSNNNRIYAGDLFSFNDAEIKSINGRYRCCLTATIREAGEAYLPLDGIKRDAIFTKYLDAGFSIEIFDGILLINRISETLQNEKQGAGDIRYLAPVEVKNAEASWKDLALLQCVNADSDYHMAGQLNQHGNLDLAIFRQYALPDKEGQSGRYYIKIASRMHLSAPSGIGQACRTAAFIELTDHGHLVAVASDGRLTRRIA